ncbi:MAG: gliding motility-associated C-terminal domain-containing protein [Bacteroidia bacterium]
MKKIIFILLTLPLLLVSQSFVVLQESNELFFPSSFSPNGDGEDDVWEIQNIGLYPDAVIKIYNRWGELMFESDKFVKGWDGRNKGKPVEIGVYYYTVKTGKPAEKDFSGFFTLKR